MAKKKQLSIEQRARIDILAAEGFSQRSIAKKLGISKFGVFENSRGGLQLLACSVCYANIYKYLVTKLTNVNLESLQMSEYCCSRNFLLGIQVFINCNLELLMKTF